MIAYRPIAPLTIGRPDLMSALADLTAVFDTTWEVSKESSAALDKTAQTAGNAYPVAAGRYRS